MIWVEDNKPKPNMIYASDFYKLKRSNRTLWLVVVFLALTNLFHNIVRLSSHKKASKQIEQLRINVPTSKRIADILEELNK